MKYRTITPATVYPCELNFLRDQLRQPPVSQDGYLISLIEAATDRANDYTGRQFNRCTLMAYSFFKGAYTYELHKGPVIDVTKVEMIKADGTVVAFVDTELLSEFFLIQEEYSAYLVITATEKVSGISTLRPDAVQITYNAGYSGESGSVFPSDVVNAVAMAAARMYTNPDDGVDEKTSISENLLKKYRCPIV